MGKWPKTKVPTLIKCKKSIKNPKKNTFKRIYKKYQKSKTKKKKINVKRYQKYSVSQCNIETQWKVLKHERKSTNI